MIELRDVTHAYEDRTVLRGITLDLHEHRIGIIGANGSGKSTLARTLNGLVVPDSGSVLVDGCGTRRDSRAARRRVGFVFSDASAQILMPTVAEDVALGLRHAGLSAEETRRRVDAVLRRHGLYGHRDHPAHLLSGGQKQMLALASVLVTEPDVLVCDEPTTLLDMHNARVIQRTLRGLPQQLILLTHQLDMLADFDRVLVMDDGRVVFDGAPDAAVAHYTALMDARAEVEEEAVAVAEDAAEASEKGKQSEEKAEAA